MIKLDVQEYCHECDAFDPVLVDGTKYYSGDEVVMKSDCYVRCRYAKRCAQLLRHLEKRMEKTNASHNTDFNSYPVGGVPML